MNGGQRILELSRSIKDQSNGNTALLGEIFQGKLLIQMGLANPLNIFSNIAHPVSYVISCQTTCGTYMEIDQRSKYQGKQHDQ